MIAERRLEALDRAVLVAAATGTAAHANRANHLAVDDDRACRPSS